MIRMVSMPGTPWKASLEAKSSRTGKEIYGTDGQLGYSVDSALGGSLLCGDHPVLEDRNSFCGSDSFTNGAPGVDDW